MTIPVYFSPSRLAFYHGALMTAYRQANSLPHDLVPITDAVWKEYSRQPPAGFQLGIANNQPAWVPK